MSSDVKVWTIKSIMEWSTSYLKEKDIPSARVEVELLLSLVMKLKRIELYAYFDRPLESKEKAEFKEFLLRRAAGEPVAYIVGSKDFMGRSFIVNNATLIPRSDTEVLVEAAKKYLSSTQSKARVLDVGAGSGCISLTLALDFPESCVEAWDVSPDALVVAKENKSKLACDNIVFKEIDMAKDEAWKSDGKFDLIVTNPPYIGEGERKDLDASVLDFEPELALFANNEGLYYYEVLAKHAHEKLKDSGKLMMEVGYLQRELVSNLFLERGWRNIECIQDYGGRDRVITANR